MIRTFVGYYKKKHDSNPSFFEFGFDDNELSPMRGISQFDTVLKEYFEKKGLGELDEFSIGEIFTKISYEKKTIGSALNDLKKWLKSYKPKWFDEHIFPKRRMGKKTFQNIFVTKILVNYQDDLIVLSNSKDIIIATSNDVFKIEIQKLEGGLKQPHM